MLFQHDYSNDQFSEVSVPVNQQAGRGMWNQVIKDALWDVEDRASNNPGARFHQQGYTNPYMELVYETNGTSPMDHAPVPRGLVNFLQMYFLPKLNITDPLSSGPEDVIATIWRFLDWQEPYFYLIDMPVSLVQDGTRYTYRQKTRDGKLRDTLDPRKLEVFEVQRGWKFDHYHKAKAMLEHETVQRVVRGEQILHKKENRPLSVTDVLDQICRVVWGAPLTQLEGYVCEWLDGYYEDLVYNHKRTPDENAASKWADERELSFVFWLAAAVGTFMWLKSPHGLKFLVEWHPIYQAVLCWDEQAQTVRVAPGSGGVAVVTNWDVYTLESLDRTDAIHPGTCVVLNQNLHCTELVHSRSIMHPVCDCGKPRPVQADSDSALYSNGHYSANCREYEKRHPDNQVVFLSYGAAYNLLNKHDMNTPCPRHACPNTVCKLHAGYYARANSLNQQRTKMLPSGSAQ